MKRYKIMLIFLLFVTNALVILAGTQNERCVPVVKHEPEENSEKDMPKIFCFRRS